MAKMCYLCKSLKETVHTDSNDLHYCQECMGSFPTPSVVRAMNFLMLTIPYAAGDRVECRTGGEIFDGIGTVDGVSFDLKDGGTPVYPAFHVVLDEKAYPDAPDECWYTEVCLKPVEKVTSDQS